MEVLKERKEFDLKAMMTSEFPEVQLEHAKPFMELMMQYRCALMEVETKLNVLNAEFTMKNNRNPFESIKSRIKSPVSILEKMHPEVTCTSRGTPGCPASTRERPRETFFNTSRGQIPLL